MIDALIAGRMYGKAVSRTSKLGRAFATAKLRVSMRDGESLFANVIAFALPAVTALLALEDGDSAALSGELTLTVWLDKEGKPRPGVDVLAYAVLTEYHVSRKRRAVQPSEPAEVPFDDELPASFAGGSPR